MVSELKRVIIITSASRGLSRVIKNISKVRGRKVDWLINNASVMAGTGAEPMTGISKSTVKEWEDQFKINVLGLVFFTIALILLLEKGNRFKDKGFVFLALNPSWVKTELGLEEV
ncbi:hypothetical protein EDB81DRAFT_767412 [Dactylonectria macrodidyma]|uniref:Uncharacterized protein n=1 Tax=Dactylonectria macrodidyma TaxID=307937 RepID=A0A9P9DBX0_9HYPO|nr:hypothetical protein EDB81DRAFT_767412 [Dactylonectria macrodidyma]